MTVVYPEIRTIKQAANLVMAHLNEHAPDFMSAWMLGPKGIMLDVYSDWLVDLRGARVPGTFTRYASFGAVNVPVCGPINQWMAKHYPTGLGFTVVDLPWVMLRGGWRLESVHGINWRRDQRMEASPVERKKLR